jgi:hypothetical protein
MSKHRKSKNASASRPKVTPGKPERSAQRKAVAFTDAAEHSRSQLAPDERARVTHGAQPVTQRAGEKRRAASAQQAQRDSAESRLMSAMLARGCGISDTLARVRALQDTPTHRLRRALQLKALLEQIGPLARNDGGAGKSPRAMRRTRAFAEQLISGLQRELRSDEEYSAPNAGHANGHDQEPYGPGSKQRRRARPCRSRGRTFVDA